MHRYSSDNFFRSSNVYLFLGFLAIYASSFFRKWLPSTPLAEYIDTTAFSVGVIYAALIVFFEYRGWRWFSTIRNLNGTWVGYVTSNYNGGDKLDCGLRIRQTWTRMNIELETGQSRSRTTMSAFYENQPGDLGLKYEYVSEPKHRAVETMQTHRGFCNMIIDESNHDLKMSGNYFTGRGRETNGEISLTRVSNQNLSYESALEKLKS